MNAKSLPPIPSLKQLKHQAKDLCKAHQRGAPEAVARIRANFPKFRDRDDAAIAGSRFGLQDAQLVVAREHGFEAWASLRAAVRDSVFPGFLDAVRRNDVVKVRALIEDFPEFCRTRVAGSCWEFEGPMVVRDADRSCMALHHCAAKGYAELAELLLKNGADANARGWEGGRNYGMTVPVVLAAWEGNARTLTVLLQHGADPNSDDGAAMDTALRHRVHDKCRILIEHGAHIDITVASALGMDAQLGDLLKHNRQPVSLEPAVIQNQVRT